MSGRRLKGHAYRGWQQSVCNDFRYVCECGDTGNDARSIAETRIDHRFHKESVWLKSLPPESRGEEPKP